MSLSAGFPWPGLWVERLKARLESLDGPLVQIQGWPGSGKRRLLRLLVQAGGLEVAPRALEDPEALTRAAERARQRESSLLLCRRWPEGAATPAARILDALPTRPLLVFTGRRRQDLDVESSSLLPPEELLLNEAEAAALWRTRPEGRPGQGPDEGPAPAAADLQRALERTHGWLRPLELLLAAGGDEKDGKVLSFLDQVVAQAGRDPLAGLASWGFPEDETALPPLLREALRRQVSETRRRSEGRAAGLEVSKAERLRFRVELLGIPRVLRLGPERAEEEVTWTLRRCLQTFAYLVTDPRQRASRKDLVEVAFREESPEVVRKNFHPTLSHLRRNLRGKREGAAMVKHRAGVYFLDPEVEWEVDVSRFTAGAGRVAELQRQGRAEEAARLGTELWSLYKGPFFEGEDGPWALRRRDELQRTYLGLLREVGRAFLSLDRLQESLDAFRTVLLEDPLQEEVQVAVMGIYAAQGRRDLVRRQYDRLSQLLVEDLGVEPLPETTFEYHRLMG